MQGSNPLGTGSPPAIGLVCRRRVDQAATGAFFGRLLSRPGGFLVPAWIGWEFSACNQVWA